MKMLEVDITYTTENKDPVEFTVPQLLPNYEIIDFTFLTFNYFYKFSSPFMFLGFFWVMKRWWRKQNRVTSIASALSFRKGL